MDIFCNFHNTMYGHDDDDDDDDDDDNDDDDNATCPVCIYFS